MQIPGEERLLPTGTCCVFLEFAMTCLATGVSSQACVGIDAFGTRLGRARVNQIEEGTPLNLPCELAGRAVKRIRRTMERPFRLEASSEHFLGSGVLAAGHLSHLEVK